MWIPGKRDLKGGMKCVITVQVPGPKKKKAGPDFRKELSKLLKKYSGRILYRMCAQK